MVIRLRCKTETTDFEPVPNPAAADDIGAEPARERLPAAARSPASPRKSEGFVLWCATWLSPPRVSVLIITFLYQPVRVEGTSMLPRLEDRDRLFINKFVYHISSIERGDVVVFHYPRDPEKSYIKRVIALPGDRCASIMARSGERQAAGRALCPGGVSRYSRSMARDDSRRTAIS